MAQNNITKQNNDKNILEFRQEIIRDGISIENIYCNGVKVAVGGFSSEADKQAAMRTWQKALDSSSSLGEAMEKMIVIAELSEKEITPDKQIEIGDEKVFINFEKREAYDLNGDLLVELNDLQGVNLPNEAIEALLIARIELLWA